MAYEKINVSNLKKALNKIDDINYENINSLSGKLTDNEWGSPIRGRIKTALNVIVNEYKNIQKKINNYKTACNYIDEYQKLAADIKSYNNSLSTYKSDLNNYNNKLYDHKRTMESYDSNTLDSSRNYTQGRIDYYNLKISNTNYNISNINSKLSSAKSKQKELSNKINNLIN